MLELSCHDSCQAERRWIAAVLLEGWLGLRYRLRFEQRPGVRLSAGGKTLELADTFFAAVAGDWLSAAPEQAPSGWLVADSGLAPRLLRPAVPVLFGAGRFSLGQDGKAELGLDVFGSAFFMLSRYEEACSPRRDLHQRFPLAAAAAARHGCVDRPIVDEYTEILWAAITRLWPDLRRKRRQSRKLISCDVDLPFDPACASLPRLGKRMLARAWRERSWQAFGEPLRNYRAVRRGAVQADPYRQALDWMMTVNERAGNQLSLNILPLCTDDRMDRAGALDRPPMHALLRDIAGRGHLIGFHPGYNSFRQPAVFGRSIALLRRVLDQLGIDAEVAGGRQHYLRWDARQTARLWQQHGLRHDSTLGWPSEPGFRCGTCHEYPMYDLVARQPLTLLQRPLVLMETTVIDRPGEARPPAAAALAAMQQVQRACRQFDGDFTLLWHNSSFSSGADRELYHALIQ